jgi:hypothetical protein
MKGDVNVAQVIHDGVQAASSHTSFPILNELLPDTVNPSTSKETPKVASHPSDRVERVKDNQHFSTSADQKVCNACSINKFDTTLVCFLEGLLYTCEPIQETIRSAYHPRLVQPTNEESQI